MGDPVYAFGAPPMPGGTIDYPLPFAFLLFSGVDPYNLGSHEGLGYLLQAGIFDTSVATSLPGLPMPGGEIDAAVPCAFGWQGGSSTIWPAATHGRSSRPDDTPANLYIPGKLEPGFNYTMELCSGADPASAGSNTVGVLEIDDVDGELDGLTQLGWDGATLTLLRGDPSAMYAGWTVVANMTAAGMLYDPRTKEIQLRDMAWLLNAAPLHGEIYGGTGDLDGDASLVGVVKPYAVGHFFNVTPTLIGAALLCYQVSFTAVQAITAKDGGVALVNDGDVADYATLAAATIADGHYLTCLAQGCFRLGGKPFLICTADGIGDATVLNAHGAPGTRGQIARRLATGYGLVKLDDATQLDGASFVAMESKQPAACGWFWNAAITKADALSEVMSGCLGYWFMRLNGTFSIGQFEDPASQSAYVTLPFPAPGAGEARLSEPSMTDYKTPVRQTFIGYQRNYTPLQTNQIAGELDLTTSSILQNATQYAGSTDTWAANTWPTGPIVTVDSSGFAFQADAQVETDRQQALRRTRRERWSLPGALDPLGDFVGRIVAIANFGRLSFGSQRNFLCVGMSAQGGVKIELWG